MRPVSPNPIEARRGSGGERCECELRGVDMDEMEAAMPEHWAAEESSGEVEDLEKGQPARPFIDPAEDAIEEDRGRT